MQRFQLECSFIKQNPEAANFGAWNFNIRAWILLLLNTNTLASVLFLQAKQEELLAPFLLSNIKVTNRYKKRKS